MLYKILICIINIVIHMKDRSESETLCTILQKITNTQCIISSIFHQLFPYVITLFWNTESQFLKKKKILVASLVLLHLPVKISHCRWRGTNWESLMLEKGTTELYDLLKKHCALLSCTILMWFQAMQSLGSYLLEFKCETLEKRKKI